MGASLGGKVREKRVSFADILKAWLGGRSPESVAQDVGHSERAMRFLYNGQSVPALTRAAAWSRLLGLSEERVRLVILESQKARKSRKGASVSRHVQRRTSQAVHL